MTGAAGKRLIGLGIALQLIGVAVAVLVGFWWAVPVWVVSLLVQLAGARRAPARE